MKLVIRGMTPDDWAWFYERNPVLQVVDSAGIVGLNADTGERVAGCIFDSFTETSVQAHLLLSSPFALKHGFIDFCLDYVFKVEGRNIMYGLVPSNNYKARRLNKRLGFTELCVLEKAFSEDEDYILMELRKENAQYTGYNNGRKIRQQVGQESGPDTRPN